MKMYEGVLEKVESNRRKRGVVPINEGFKFKLCKFLYFLAFVYSLVMSLPVIIGFLMKASQSQDGFSAFVSDRLVGYATLALGTLLLIVGCVLILKKKRSVLTVSVALVLTVACSVALIFFFKDNLIDELTDKVKTMFYWRHLIPLGLTALLSVIVCGIDLTEKLRVRKEYNTILATIYEIHKQTTGQTEIGADEWDEFLENYNPETYKPQFKKNREEDVEE